MKLYAIAWSFLKDNIYYIDSAFATATGEGPLMKDAVIGHSLRHCQEKYPISEGYTNHGVSACLVPDEIILEAADAIKNAQSETAPSGLESLKSQ